MPTHTEVTQNQTHQPIMEQAIQFVEELPLIAVDCACGAGNESAFLLSQNYQVYAFDVAEISENICLTRFQNHQNYYFTKQTFEEYQFPKASLIVALLSLFFCQPQHFQTVFNNIYNALFEHGIFVVDLLGDQDAWVKHSPQQFIGFSQTELESLLNNNFEILHQEEMLGEYPLANGQLKFWHKHRLILRKKSQDSST